MRGRSPFGLVVVAEQSKGVELGALMAHGADIPDLFRSAASYVDRAIKGEKAAELAIQLSIESNLVINLEDAKRLNLQIPSALLALADQVIERRSGGIFADLQNQPEYGHLCIVALDDSRAKQLKKTFVLNCFRY